MSTKNCVLRRVVVTGIGLVSPLGMGWPATWKGLLEGRSGIGPITYFDTTGYNSRIAGQLDGFDPQDFMDRKQARKMDPFIQYAVAASQLAVDDAGIDPQMLQGDRNGVYIGSGIGGIGTIEKNHRTLMEKGPTRISPFFLVSSIINEAAGQVSIRFQASGPNSATANACATGTHAIGDSFKIIALGGADRMLAGGSEAPVTPLGVAGFCSMRALSQRNDAPEKASRPFDKDRDGFVVGEGAGVLLLEDLDSALARNARIYAELVGYGMCGDAYHVSAPRGDADGMCRSMQRAMRDAEISPNQISYINAHGTSTPLNDRLETMAINRVFGDYAKRLPISSSKSMTGHLLGAAGGLETGVTALTLKYQIAHPTINQDTPDPECQLDYIPGEARKGEFEYGLTNSFGFGGTNGTLVLKRFLS